MIEKTIKELELQLLDPTVRSEEAALDQLLTEDFTEFGSSGRVYGKHDILATLPTSDDVQKASITNFSASRSGNIVHVRYQLEVTDSSGGTRLSLRSSVWRQVGDSWRMCFHQGTVVGCQNAVMHAHAGIETARRRDGETEG